MTVQVRKKRRQRRAEARSLRRRRLLLLAGSVLLTAFVLEALARVLLLPPVAFHVRDRLYQNALPRLASPHSFAYDTRGALPSDKEPGEIRVVVLGESSVEGAPFGPNASPVAMLHDMLTVSLPDRAITVVNMGRATSMVTTTYYHLIHILRYDPDIVIFYLGTNDHERVPGEQCAMGAHPILHSVWRGLVENSALLWVARVLGPSYLGVAREFRALKGTCDYSTLRQWYELLIRLAADSGAEVVVTSPVRTSVALLEPGLPDADSGNYDMTTMAPDYKELLECRLQRGCDFPSALEEVMDHRERLREEEYRGSEGTAERPELDTAAARTKVWREAADAVGCRFVDFRAVLLAASPGGFLYERFFSDEVHLSARGYLFLARHWHDQVLEILSGERAGDAALPSEEDVQHYRLLDGGGSVGLLTNYLRRGWYLTAIPGLEEAAAPCPGPACSEEAQVALGWLRTQVGLDPGVDPALRERVEAFSLEDTRPDGYDRGSVLPVGAMPAAAPAESD